MSVAYYFSEIKSILERNNYIVKIQRLRNKIIISYPGRVEVPATKSSYSIFYLTKGKLYLRVTVNNKTIFNNSINIEPYAYKAVIIAHVMKVCIDINYHTEFVRFFLENKEVNEEEFAITPFVKLSKQDCKRELTLLGMLPRLFTNDPSIEQVGKQFDVLDGCKFIQTQILGIKNEQRITNGE